MTETERAARVRGWNKAVSKSLGWVGYGDDEDYRGHLDAFQPVARPMSSRSVASSSKSSANDINGKGLPPTPLQQIVESARVVASFEVPALINETAKNQTAALQEANDQAAATQEEENLVAPLRDLPMENDPTATNDLPLEPKKYSTAALGWTAAAALGAGLLLGSSRRR